MQAKVVIYSKDYCPYCKSAMAFFRGFGIVFEEIDITDNPQGYEELRKRTGHRTVPQIFIGDKFIGGYTELIKAHEQGTILPLLGK